MTNLRSGNSGQICGNLIKKPTTAFLALNNWLSIRYLHVNMSVVTVVTKFAKHYAEIGKKTCFFKIVVIDRLVDFRDRLLFTTILFFTIFFRIFE